MVMVGVDDGSLQVDG